MELVMFIFKPKNFLVFCALVLIAYFGLSLISMNISHGDAKHYTDAQISRQCNLKPDLTYEKGDNKNRRVNLCLTPVGLAIQVVERINGKWEEITSYINHEYLTPEELIGYMEEDKGTHGIVTFAKQYIKVLCKDLCIMQ